MKPNRLSLALDGGGLQPPLLLIARPDVHVHRANHRRRHFVRRHRPYVLHRFAHRAVERRVRRRRPSDELRGSRNLRKRLRETQSKPSSPLARRQQPSIHRTVIQRHRDSQQLFKRRERRNRLDARQERVRAHRRRHRRHSHSHHRRKRHPSPHRVLSRPFVLLPRRVLRRTRVRR